jgi:hypothetical protein
MITVRRCLIPTLLVLSLAVPTIQAAQWTVYPTSQTNCTGYTDYAAKHDGTILIYGGAVTGTVRKGNGYLKFDLSAVPDGITVTAVQWNFYVGAANYPYWTVTPLDADPASLAGTSALVWEDLEAEADTGYYNYESEGSTYGPGWKSMMLGGTANADITAALDRDWFAFGAVSRDTTLIYYLEIDGHTDANVPFLVVFDDPQPVNDTCAGAIAIPGTPGSSSYSGDTTFATNDYSCSASCMGGLSHAGPDVTYSITLPANCEICVTLNQSAMTWNGAVYMVTDCADVNGTCVAGASGWLPGGGDEIFCYSDTGTRSYYIIVDGRTGGGSGPFQLDVDLGCLQGPSGLTCTDKGMAVQLEWSNNDIYDNIEVYMDNELVATLSSTVDTFIHLPEDKGYHCYHVCGTTIDGDSSCSNDCCLIFGYDNVEILWDFEVDDGGFVVDGTGGWQWGAPTHGPCFDTADGKVWGTDLDDNYPEEACWLLDSVPVYLEGKGGFICIEHCYETEVGFDGGVVWFTTDDNVYWTFDPVEGADGAISGFSPLCHWVEGRSGFTGSSGGWVTDCWDFTDSMWMDEDVKLRFAFGSDSAVVHSGWLIDNITIYNNFTCCMTCDYTVTPLAGTVPFQTVHRLTLYNYFTGGAALTRRVAGRIAVTLGNGTYYNPWRAGYTNIAPMTWYSTQFPVNIPALATVIGNIRFTLSAMDVTPAPYNQPPYPPAGSTCTRTNIVVANAP